MPGRWTLIPSAGETATMERRYDCPYVTTEPVPTSTAENTNIDKAKKLSWETFPLRDCDAHSKRMAWRGKLLVSRNCMRHHVHRYHNSPSYVHRCALHAADYTSILAGGLATVVILNFNQSPGTCSPLETDHRWPIAHPFSIWLPQTLRCPSVPIYLVSLSTYSAAGVFQLLARKPKYCAECGLLAVLASLLAGALYGGRMMVDVLVLGGFLSLLCSKVVDALFEGWRSRESAGLPRF